MEFAFACTFSLASMKMQEDSLPKVECKHGRLYVHTTFNWLMVFVSLVTTTSISPENN